MSRTAEIRPIRSLARALVALLSGLMLGCGAEAPDGPPELRPGLDACSYCRMIVSEPRFAAVGRSTTGETAHFDDLGCAERFLAERSTSTGESWQFWLHAFEGEGWIPADRAWLVEDPATITPMGHGLLAYGDEATARARADRSPEATIRRW